MIDVRLLGVSCATLCLGLGAGYLFGARQPATTFQPEVSGPVRQAPSPGAVAPTETVAPSPEVRRDESCDERLEHERVRADQLCAVRLHAAGCVESLAWPASIGPAEDRAAWEERLDDLEQRCPGVRDDVIDVDCGEYPCMLVARRTVTALQECGLQEEGVLRSMESALEGEPFTAVVVYAPSESVETEAIGDRMTTRFGQLWQIHADEAERPH